MKRPLILLAVVAAVMVLAQSASAQWVPTNGPGRSTVRALAISDDSLYAGTYGDGVFLSTDSGMNWTAINSGLTNHYITALAFSGSYLFAGEDGAGVFRSTDNGASWTAVNSGLGFYDKYVQCFAVNGSELFLGADFGSGGVFRSRDSGTSWIATNSGLTNHDITALVISRSNIFAATAGGDGVYLSIDSGANWTAVNSGLTSQWVYSLVVSGSNIFAGTACGLFLSSDSGISWTNVGSSLPACDNYPLAVNGITIYSSNGSNGGSVFLSTNNGTNWNAVRAGLPATRIKSFLINGSMVFAGTDNGIVWRWAPHVPILIPCSPDPTSNYKPQFQWYPPYDSSITLFRIQLDTNRQFTVPIVSVAVTDTFFTPSGDLPYDTIYWRVGNDADTLTWSTVSSVKIIHSWPTLIPYSPNPTYNRRPQFYWYRNDSISV